MKKLFFIAAIAGAALVSCTKNELAPSVTAQEEISFTAPVVGVQTKVYGAIGTTYDKAESFDVWSKWNKTAIAEWGGTDYIVDKPVTHNAANPGGWHFTPAYYWPADGYLSFVALSPSMTNETSYDATTGFSITTWTQGQYKAVGGTYDIIDLMYSEPTPFLSKANINPADGEESATDADKNSYKGVDITFKHALSYLVFKIKTAANYSATTQFRLTGIELSGVYTTGKFTQKATDPWEESTSATGTYVAYAGTLPFGATEAEANAATGKEIILLPQTLVAGKQKIKITYEIRTLIGTNASDETHWSAWIPDQEQSADILNTTVGEWKMGNKYTYTISLGMDEIVLDPAVDDWDDYEPEPGVTL